jgi:predicted acetyltransferase
MEFKMVTPANLVQVEDLWDYCFEKADTPFFKWYFSEYCLKNNLVLGGFEEKSGQLINMLHLNPYNVLVRGNKEAMPYIVGVATNPAFRGQHLTAPLLDMAFKVLRGEHFAFALLMPISAGIYQPYEFAYCYFKHHYEMPLAALHVPEPSLDTTVVRVKKLEAGYFAHVYDAYAARHNGMVVRNDFQWDKLLAVHTLENVQAVVAYSEGEITGYAFYKIENNTFNVIELLYLNIDARNALLKFAKGHLSAAEKFIWGAADDDLTYLDFTHQEFTGSVEPFMMARCIDAGAALKNMTIPANLPDGEVTVILSDKFIKENNYLVTIKAQQGEVSMELTDAAEEVVLDMGAFTQMYLGAFTATELAEAGKIRVLKPEKLAFLDALFPKMKNYINEYF